MRPLFSATTGQLLESGGFSVPQGRPLGMGLGQVAKLSSVGERSVAGAAGVVVVPTSPLTPTTTTAGGAHETTPAKGGGGGGVTVQTTPTPTPPEEFLRVCSTVNEALSFGTLFAVPESFAALLKNKQEAKLLKDVAALGVELDSLVRVLSEELRLRGLIEQQQQRSSSSGPNKATGAGGAAGDELDGRLGETRGRIEEVLFELSKHRQTLAQFVEINKSLSQELIQEPGCLAIAQQKQEIAEVEGLLENRLAAVFNGGTPYRSFSTPWHSPPKRSPPPGASTVASAATSSSKAPLRRTGSGGVARQLNWSDSSSSGSGSGSGSGHDDEVRDSEVRTLHQQPLIVVDDEEKEEIDEQSTQAVCEELLGSVFRAVQRKIVQQQHQPTRGSTSAPSSSPGATTVVSTLTRKRTMAANEEEEEEEEARGAKLTDEEADSADDVRKKKRKKVGFALSSDDDQTTPPLQTTTTSTSTTSTSTSSSRPTSTLERVKEVEGKEEGDSDPELLDMPSTQTIRKNSSSPLQKLFSQDSNRSSSSSTSVQRPKAADEGDDEEEDEEEEEEEEEEYLSGEENSHSYSTQTFGPKR